MQFMHKRVRTKHCILNIYKQFGMAYHVRKNRNSKNKNKHSWQYIFILKYKNSYFLHYTSRLCRTIFTARIPSTNNSSTFSLISVFFLFLYKLVQKKTPQPKLQSLIKDSPHAYFRENVGLGEQMPFTLGLSR